MSRVQLQGLDPLRLRLARVASGHFVRDLQAQLTADKKLSPRWRGSIRNAARKAWREHMGER